MLSLVLPKQNAYVIREKVAKHNPPMFQSSYLRYSNMTNYVDQLFPPLLEAANDYSQFVYWREPIPNILDVNVAETLTN